MCQKDFDIESIDYINKMGFHHNYNGIYIMEGEVKILKDYGFDINDFNNIDELIYTLNNYLNESGANEEIESILTNLEEFNYYNNTRK